MVYVARLSTMSIHSSKEAQIGFLLAEKAFTEVLCEYYNDINIFSPELAIGFPEYAGMNNYTINLEEGKQPPYSLIYSLNRVKLEILKTYIETEQKTGFI